MQNYFLFLFILLSVNSSSQTATPGQLKVTIQSFKCINKSWDGVVEFDGHGNEVSVNFSYRIYSPSNPGAARKNSGGSVIFGSNVNGQTRAGTQTPDLGGINNNDVVNVNLPVIDEFVNADEYIIIAPTVWEWDTPERNTLNSFNAQLERDLDFAVSQPFPFAATPVSFFEPFVDRNIKIFDKYRSYGMATKYQSIFQNCFCPGNSQGNRVIGVRAGTFSNQCTIVYPPTLILLDTRALYALYAERENHPTQGINIRYTENSYGIQTSNGIYEVFLKIEFIPYSAPVTSNAPRPKTPRQPFINTASNSSDNAVIAGTWKGTYGNGENSDGNFYSFQLNVDGSMQVLSDVGGVIANGNYSFSKTGITGNYSYSDGRVFNFAGTVNENNMSGTWAAVKGRGDGGKWVMRKK